MSIEEKRRAAFEAWLESAGFDVERFHFINGYRGNEQMAAWEAWNAALDSICVEVPDSSELVGDYGRETYRIARDEFMDALEAAGVPYK